jgi:hemerythrin-like domain-containing protein
MYRRHIEVEDREVFPVAARVLPKQEQEAIAREMAARRNVASTVSIK